MFSKNRLNTRLLVTLSLLLLSLYPAGPTPVQAKRPIPPARGLRQTCDVPGTPFFAEYYGTVTLDGEPAPISTVVEAYNPRGERAGCVEVAVPGYYPYLRVYRGDPDANPPIPGMQPGEEVTFKVNGNVAQSDPSPVIWTDDLDQHQVDLSATSAACPYDFNDTPGVDSGDITLIAGAWRATDAASLARYDFNDNNKVDVEDIMTVAERLGEPCP